MIAIFSQSKAKRERNKRQILKNKGKFDGTNINNAG